MTLLTFALTFVLAGVPAPVSAAVTQYDAAVAEFQAKRKGASIQRVLEAAVAARNAVDAGLVRDLDDAALEELRAAMPAIEISRDARTALRKDVLVSLAERHGSTADADFAAAWIAAHPAGEEECTRFAELPARYRGWFAFSRKHKSAYRAQVIEEIERTERLITTATCACDDAASVRTALADIARDFPLGKITQRVRQRIQDLDRGTSDLRFDCSN
ncbi:MAG TPA: hypothetical protein VFT12_05275 [Thermoanaerobaculia bacterium]|nr:hypothetical protein [Thermoanaerobaculia bacterium]